MLQSIVVVLHGVLSCSGDLLGFVRGLSLYGCPYEFLFFLVGLLGVGRTLPAETPIPLHRFPMTKYEPADLRFALGLELIVLSLHES